MGGGSPKRYLEQTLGLAAYLGVSHLAGPSLVMRREKRKVARVTMIKVLGKVLR